MTIGFLDRAAVGLMPIIPKPIVRMLSSRYIAGAGLDDAVRVVRDLNSRGIMATLDVLGEYITSLTQAETAARDMHGTQGGKP